MVKFYNFRVFMMAINSTEGKCSDLHVTRGVSHFGYKLICLHDQSCFIGTISSTLSESIHLHQSRFAYTYKSKYFLTIDENHCL